MKYYCVLEPDQTARIEFYPLGAACVAGVSPCFDENKGHLVWPEGTDSVLKEPQNSRVASLSTAHELDGALDELGVAVLKLQQSRGGVGSKLSAEFRKRTSSIGEALKKSPATPRGKDLGSR